MSQFADFQTDNDTILQFSAKHSSSKAYCQKFANFIEIKVLDELEFNLRTLEEAEKVLEYRKRIVEAHQEAERKKDSDKSNKLQRRVKILETNFESEWE